MNLIYLLKYFNIFKNKNKIKKKFIKIIYYDKKIFVFFKITIKKLNV